MTATDTTRATAPAPGHSRGGSQARPSDYRPTRQKKAPIRPTSRWGMLFPVIVVIVAVVYFLIPIIWVLIASTKSTTELFSTPAFVPGGNLGQNLVNLFTYENGMFVRWLGNSFLYSVVGAALSTVVSASAGYALALYRFPGKKGIMIGLLGGVLLPGVTLTIPQYMLFAQWGLTNTYWAVLIPVSITPFGIYLAFVYAKVSVPIELVEAARVDGSSEFRTFRSVGIPMLVPGLVTVFLLQFIGAWNNFMLPYIMQTDSKLYPITVAMYMMLNRGGGEPVLYSLAIVGSAVAVVPVIAFVLFLQRFWRLDLVSGSLK